MAYQLYAAHELIFPEYLYTLNPLSGALLKIPLTDPLAQSLEFQQSPLPEFIYRRYAGPKNVYRPTYLARLAAKYLPLTLHFFLTKILASGFRGIRRRPPASLQQDISEIISDYGRESTDGTCMPRAASLYFQLSRRGQRPRIFIGVFTPTNQMHAWTAVGQEVILENEDYLQHFQVIYSYT